MSIVISRSDLFKAAILSTMVVSSLIATNGGIRSAKADPVNCARAAKPAEFLVCNNENLRVLDEELHVLHREKLAFAGTKPQRQAVKKERMRWVAKRNACGGDEVCLATKYRTEIIELNGNLLSFN